MANASSNTLRPLTALQFDESITVAAAYSMRVRDRLVRVRPLASYTVRLPPVTEAIGGIYALRVVEDGPGVVTIVDNGDSVIAVSDTIEALNDFGVLYSDGETWYFLLLPQTPPA